ncbi:histidine kinase, partial [Aureobasidium melanogenum]
MNSLFNSALRQSNAIRKDLDAFAESATTSPALQGQLTTSLTSFSRTLDDYSRSAQQELVPEKAQKAQDRLTNFRAELLDYRSRFALLKAEHEEKLHQNNRNDLLGHRRPHGANATPENPYADSAIASSSRDAGANPLFRTRDGFVNTPTGAVGSNPYSSYQSPYALSTDSGDQARENHALREQNFFASTNATLDEYLERGRAVLGDLGEQRDMLKNTQRKLYSVANTLGISGDTIRMVERRTKQDKWIFWTGVVVFVVFVYFVLKWLRRVSPTANMSAPGHEALVDTLIDLISYDDRPTLLLDTITRRIRFCNIAFDSLLRGTAISTDLQSWADSLCTVEAHATHEPIDLGTFAHQKWLGKSLGNSVMTVFCRWTSAPATPGVDAVTFDHDQQIDKAKGSSETQKLTDMYMGWLELRDDPWMSYVNNYPFHETSLGPISSWHPQLRCAVQRMMVCPESRILYWGDEHAMIYNEAAIPILGKRHPCLGMPLKIWGRTMFDQIDADIKSVVVAGRAQQMKNAIFELHRDGYSEQTWHNFYHLPIAGPDGHYLGCLGEFAETTTAVVQENRAAILDAFIKPAANATSLKQLWPIALDALSKTSIDIVTGCIFSVSNAGDSTIPQSSFTSQDYVLEASSGIANTESRLSSSILKSLNRTSDYEKLLVLRQDDGSLPTDLHWSTSDQAAIRVVCVLPITDLNNRRLAVAIFGMNPGRPFDEGSRSFMSQIGDLIRKSAIFITLPEEQKKTAAITSALSDKLQIALLEAEIHENSYARMARQAPIGMYSLRPDGYPVFVNDAYLELHGVTRTQFYKSADGNLGWNPTVYDEDLPLVENMWLSTINGTAPVQAQLRLKAPDFPNNVRWVESMSFAERDKTGKIMAVQGWLLDVSPRKMNEQLISEKLQDALENKRATETFLDMLSHEMRNPLSSILQLADGIISLLETPPAPDTIESLKDSAQTITLCARHMKTIIDEVLTFSKLDSNLLVLSLERAQVPTIIETALKMFEKEIEHANIVANMEVDQSYVDLAVDYVLVDPSRFLQVIINFFSNSIKFTKFERERRIIVKLAASVTKPTEKDFGIAFLSPRKDITKDSSMPTTPATAGPDIKLGEEVYIYVGVEDTGRGLTEDECKVLFQRFAQASPKTYKTYGGSGLGLFISRGLAELQGGQIGVKSTAGVGSTFAFFIKTRRAEPPAPASHRGSVASTEALTDVSNLPHAEGKQDVKVLTLSSVAEESNISVKDLHVLVCEDNKINQKVIAQQLRRLGVNSVHVADDGLAALNFLATTTFFSSTSSSPSAVPLSIILMDVEMPVMDGLGAVRRIRQLESRSDITTHVPVIAITANARPEQVAVALEAGMDEVVTKPFLVRELVPRMVALVQKYMKGG